MPLTSNVIKAGPIAEFPSVTAGRKVIKRAVYDAAHEAHRMVEDAALIARSIVSEAEVERAGIFEESRRQGYQEGLAHWNDVVMEALRAKEEFLAGTENDVLRLSVRIAGKLIGEQLRLEPSTIARIVREAMKSAPREHRLIIQVSPADADAVNQNLRRLLDGATFRPPEIEVTPSESVSPGGCVIVSELGRVDAQLETQLQAMERALLKKSK